MKTALTQLIEYIEEMNNGNSFSFLKLSIKAEELLEAEKDQIMMAFTDGKISAIIKNERTPEDYYNVTHQSPTPKI